MALADQRVFGSGSRQRSNKSTKREGRPGGYAGIPFSNIRSLI
jgi:hypothetical protein